MMNGYSSFVVWEGICGINNMSAKSWSCEVGCKCCAVMSQHVIPRIIYLVPLQCPFLIFMFCRSMMMDPSLVVTCAVAGMNFQEYPGIQGERCHLIWIHDSIYGCPCM